MANAYDYDLYVIGAGSGGVRASRISAGFGARVAVAEDRPLGGTCVNVGCVPKKLFVYSSHTSEDIEDAAGYGWTVEGVKFHWPTLIANKNKEIERLNGIYRKLLDNAGVDLHEARATLVDAHTVDVAGRQVTAETILIATGGWPYLPDIPGVEHAITSNEAFFLDDLPKRVAVIGGGYIAVEFAGIFNGMGSKVTQLYRGEQILRGFDADVRHTLAEEIRKKGIDLRCHVNVMRIDKTDTGLTLHLTDDSMLEVDTVMFATGRVPNTKDLNLHDIGVATDEKGAIPGRRVLQDLGRQHLRHRRRDRPHRAHPRRDHGGHGLRPHPLWRHADGRRPRQRAVRRVQPAAGRLGRPDGRGGARRARRRPHLPLHLYADEAHHDRPG